MLIGILAGLWFLVGFCSYRHFSIRAGDGRYPGAALMGKLFWVLFIHSLWPAYWVGVLQLRVLSQLEEEE